MNTILLIEDNVNNVMLLEDIFLLDDISARLVSVETGEEALQMLPLLDPLVVLMDLTLPGMCGLDAIRTIKRDPATKGIRVWAITARNTRYDIDDALAAGCDGYFTKPVTTKQLVEQLRVFENGETRNLVHQTAGQTHEYNPAD